MQAQEDLTDGLERQAWIERLHVAPTTTYSPRHWSPTLNLGDFPFEGKKRQIKFNSGALEQQQQSKMDSIGGRRRKILQEPNCFFLFFYEESFCNARTA